MIALIVIATKCPEISIIDIKYRNMLLYSSRVKSELGSHYPLVEELTLNKASRIMDITSVDDHMILLMDIINSNLYLIFNSIYNILLILQY